MHVISAHRKEVFVLQVAEIKSEIKSEQNINLINLYNIYFVSRHIHFTKASLSRWWAIILTWYQIMSLQLFFSGRIFQFKATVNYPPSNIIHVHTMLAVFVVGLWNRVSLTVPRRYSHISLNKYLFVSVCLLCFCNHLHSCCSLVLVLCCSGGCLLCMLCFLHELFPLIYKIL